RPEYARLGAAPGDARAGRKDADGLQGQAGEDGHRGGRAHRPHDLQVDLLLRPERPPPRARGRHYYAEDEEGPGGRVHADAGRVDQDQEGSPSRGLGTQKVTLNVTPEWVHIQYPETSQFREVDGFAGSSG